MVMTDHTEEEAVSEVTKTERDKASEVTKREKTDHSDPKENSEETVAVANLEAATEESSEEETESSEAVTESSEEAIEVNLEAVIEVSSEVAVEVSSEEEVLSLEIVVALMKVDHTEEEAEEASEVHTIMKAKDSENEEIIA